MLDLPSVHFEIQQLEINTDGTAMIIAGESTAAVCVLPRPGFSRTNSAKIRPQYAILPPSHLFRFGLSQLFPSIVYHTNLWTLFFSQIHQNVGFRFVE